MIYSLVISHILHDILQYFHSHIPLDVYIYIYIYTVYSLSVYQSIGPVYQSISLSVYQSIYPNICTYQFIVYISSTKYISLYISIYIYISISIYIYIHNIDMGGSRNGGTLKWMVYNLQSEI